MTKDLTTASPLKLVIRFAFPMFLGMILQQFYSVIDTIIIGQKLGVQALAGVGSTGALSFMVIGFCTGCAMEMLARGAAGLVLALKFGFLGIQFAHPLAWLFGDILLIPAFFYCMKKVRKQAE